MCNIDMCETSSYVILPLTESFKVSLHGFSQLRIKLETLLAVHPICEKKERIEIQKNRGEARECMWVNVRMRVQEQGDKKWPRKRKQEQK